MEKGHGKDLHTMLLEGSTFEGTIFVPHNLHIDCTFTGKIEVSEEITVGQKGVVKADIKAKSAIISGKITGNLMVEDKVELKEKSSLIGDLKTKDLVINEGALFHGNCSMSDGLKDKDKV